jgi:hypothetical protein
MKRCLFCIVLGILLSLSAYGYAAQAQDEFPPSGDWRAYPLDTASEYVFKQGRPLYGESGVTLPIKVSQDGQALEFALNKVSIYEEYLQKPIRATLKRVEGGYLSDRIVLEESDTARSYSTFGFVRLSPTRAILTERFLGFEQLQVTRWLLTFGEEGDPREQLFRCRQTAPSRLVVGSRAVVLGDTPNNVRNAPSRAANRLFQVPPYLNLGLIEEDAVLSVLEGPVCANGLAWWRIKLNGREGWTAEGDKETYFLEVFEADLGTDGDFVTQQLRESAPKRR